VQVTYGIPESLECGIVENAAGEFVEARPASVTAGAAVLARGARAKGRAQVYAALSRWLADKKVKRVASGKYEKAGTAARVGAAEPKGARNARPRPAKSAKRVVATKRAARRSKRSKRASA